MVGAVRGPGYSKQSQARGAGCFGGRRQAEGDKRGLEELQPLVKLHLPYLQTYVSAATAGLQKVFQML